MKTLGVEWGLLHHWNEISIDSYVYSLIYNPLKYLYKTYGSCECVSPLWHEAILHNIPLEVLV